MSKETAGRPLNRASRALCALGLVALAALALLSGTDRISREFSTSPSIVGWPYDTGAARSRAMSAFVRTGPASSIPYARRAILSDPISIQPVSMLGRAQLFAGKEKEARTTFEVAARLGWRDQMTELYWLDQALQAGDAQVASERLDALLREDPANASRDRLLAAVSAGPEGRTAIATRLRASPSWKDTYVSELRDLGVDELSQRVDVIRRAGRGIWDCRAVSTLTQKLISSGMLSEATAVWRIGCGASASLVYDGSFDQLDTTKTSAGFDWQLSTRGDVSIAAVNDSGGNRRLEIEVNAPRTLPVLQQPVVLSPGRYKLTWSTPDTDARAARGLMVTLDCSVDLARARPGVPVPGKQGSYQLEVDIDGSCPSRDLTFWLAPGGEIRLDNIVLTPAN